eukprot:3537270-Alexandrium_andersonii.AAC.1
MLSLWGCPNWASGTTSASGPLRAVGVPGYGEITRPSLVPALGMAPRALMVQDRRGYGRVM